MANKQKIMSDKIDPNMPYSHGIKSGDFIYVSGMTPMDGVDVQDKPDDIKEQTRRCMRYIGEVLREAGADFDDVIKFNVYLVDLDEFSQFNEAYLEFLQEPYPARCCVQVSRLVDDVKVEIEAVAKV